MPSSIRLSFGTDHALPSTTAITTAAPAHLPPLVPTRTPAICHCLPLSHRHDHSLGADGVMNPNSPFHEGSVVRKLRVGDERGEGRPKYIMRSDVLYTSPKAHRATS